jgi:putative phosphoesterase
MIGIMSDSHDNLKSIDKAVKTFNKSDVELVVHAGDLISPFTINEFKKLKSEFIAVYGNNDGEREGLKKAYESLCILEDFKEISIEGWKFSIIHGTNHSIVDAIVQSDKYDVVIRGHTHQFEIINGETLVINPGETCGYVTGKQTVVLLDTDELSYQKVDL